MLKRRYRISSTARACVTLADALEVGGHPGQRPPAALRSGAMIPR
jgi:hypothetical protein